MAEKREFVLGMLIGSAVGAAVALLYAPQGGEETRGLIRQKTGEAKERVAGVAGSVKSTVAEKATGIRESATQMVDRGRGFVETKRAQVSAAVDAGREAYTQKKSELEADVNEDLDASLGTSGTDTTNGATA